MELGAAHTQAELEQHKACFGKDFFDLCAVSSQGAGEQAAPTRGSGLLGVWGLSEHCGTRGLTAEHPHSKRLRQQAQVLLQR